MKLDTLPPTRQGQGQANKLAPQKGLMNKNLSGIVASICWVFVIGLIIFLCIVACFMLLFALFLLWKSFSSINLLNTSFFFLGPGLARPGPEGHEGRAGPSRAPGLHVSARGAICVCKWGSHKPNVLFCKTPQG